MAYFSHAFQQTFVLTQDLITSGNSSELEVPGAGAFFDAKTWNAVPLGQASVAQHPKVVFATASNGYMNGDKLGSHGGFMESRKSQVIDPNHVHRLWFAASNSGQAHIVQLGWDSSNAATAPKFYCNQVYHLRIDIKGSPALRLLDHNLYHIFDVKTACCTGDANALVDPVAVMLEFARQINESPIVSKFINANVSNAGGFVFPTSYVTLTDPTAIANATAALTITAGYSDTTFNYCSFDPNDHYELEPVVISSAQLIDDTGDPCSLFKPLTITQMQAPRTSRGKGETVLREMLLDNEYHQEPFSWDARKKELTGFGFLANTLAPAGYLYDSVCILYSTPRKYNPSGVHDNDLYLLRIYGVTSGTFMSNVADWLSAYLTSAGTGVTLETI
jgi:hypothetical protein